MLTPVPCPKCGSDDLSIDCYDTMRYSYTYVQCNSCLRLVKTMDSTEDTISAGTTWRPDTASAAPKRPNKHAERTPATGALSLFAYLKTSGGYRSSHGRKPSPMMRRSSRSMLSLV